MLKLGRNCYSVQHIFFKSDCRWVFRYTTSAINAGSTDFTVDYLVNSLGFSKEAAIVTSSKVRPFKSPEKPNSVVNLLKTSGFNQIQIKSIISSVPSILSSNADKTLKPKLKAFQDIGLCGSELADVICIHPHIFVKSVKGHISPALTVLNSLFEDKFLLLKALKKPSWMFAPPRILPSVIDLLKDYGFSIHQIKLFYFRRNKLFMNPKWLQAILTRAEEKLGIPRHSPMFFHGVCAMNGLTEESLESRFKIFKSFGWSESDILALARTNPFSLATSESKITRTLNFFMKDLGHKPVDISSRAFVITLSLERRVLPRNAVLKVLKEKRLIKPNYKILSCLALTEQQFVTRFVVPFKDEVLDLYTDYMRRACSASKTAE